MASISSKSWRGAHLSRTVRFWTMFATFAVVSAGGRLLQAQDKVTVPLPSAPEVALATTSGTESLPGAGFSSSWNPVAVPEPMLPEAPLPQTTDKPVGITSQGQPVAPAHAKYIPAGWRAQPLGVRGKIAVGTTDLYSFEDLAAVFLSAGYEQVLNSEPNYGTDKGAFGERLGAAAIREASQGLFTDMVFSPLLHEDPRYYQEGPQYNPVHRTLYAITRPLITRRDNGRQTVNGALLLGYAASAALTPAFYPESNRNFHDTLATYGGSIGGAALGFFVSEFSTDVLTALHLKHNP